MPSNHIYFQMSSFLHADKQETTLMGKRGRHFFLTLSVVFIQLEYQKQTAATQGESKQHSKEWM